MNEKALALAGVFQATELVRQAANHGTWSGYAANTCLSSLFSLQAESPQDVYGGAGRVRLGVETLISVLSGEQQHLDALRYTIGLLQIQRRFKRRASMQNQVGEVLERIAAGHSELVEHEKQDLQAEEIAKLYSETISFLSPRIVVQGRPQYLQTDRTVNWIRTLLFSGLRSAVLWDQLGGGRLNLFFGRQKMLHDAQNILGG